MAATRQLRKQRTRMWQRDPHCFYCRVVTVLPRPGHPKGPTPPNLATIDHLRPRHHPGRHEPNPNGELRRVLSCYKCNNERDRWEHENMPREKLWRMCGSVPLSMRPLEELRRAEAALLSKQPTRKRDRERVGASLAAVRGELNRRLSGAEAVV